jgi:hypothetical protein
MSVEPQGADHGAPRRRPASEDTWPLLGALVTFIATWQLTHDLGIAFEAATVSSPLSPHAGDQISGHADP